jgi:periplasmic protein CpxP/Spy
MTTELTKMQASSTPRRRGRWLWLVLAPALAFGAGASITAARAQEAGMTDDGGMSGGFMRHRLERLLDKVNATASQRSQIEGIWNGARPELKSLHQQHAALRKQIETALTGATIDPSAIEQLRQQAMSIADKTSTAFTQAVVQTAQVLTPDQRKLAQQFADQQRQQHHHGHAGQ